MFRTIVLMPFLLIGMIPETNEIEINLWGGSSSPSIQLYNSNNEMIFIVESCQLQILDASILITPKLTTFQQIISKFPFFSIFIIASLLQAITGKPS